MAEHSPAARAGERARIQRPPRDWPHLVVRILGRAATNFAEDRGTSLAAAISYYTLFSIFPLTLLAVSIFGVVLRSEDVQQRVLDAIVTQLPIEEGQEGGIADALRRAAGLGPTLTIISLVAAAWTASGLAAAIRSALNVIFEVTRRRPFLRGKLMDYVLLPIIGIPFLGGIVATGAWRFVQRRFEELPLTGDGPAWIWELGAFGISLVLSFVAFILLYRLIPHRHVGWRYAAAGAALAAVLFEALKLGFAFYLANFASYDVIYGPIASVIVLLFWVYLTANIMLFGAEVASEAPHVVHEEPRHGREHDEPGEGNWRRALWSFVRGLVLVGDEEVREAPEPPPQTAPADEEREGGTHGVPAAASRDDEPRDG